MTVFIDLLIHHGSIPAMNALESTIYWYTQIITILVFLMYFHQFVYLMLSFISKSKIKPKLFKLHKIGIVVSAKNEANVIANLINSIYASDYPRSLINIFVVADNCTDNTAEICRNMGCTVFERFDTEHIGKGYALNYLFTKLHTEEQYKDLVPEAYIVLDADNTITKNYITEMNKGFDSGYDVVTSYRNSSNFGTNWISASYGYWFLHESCQLNNGRMIMKSSCTILGTGFLVASDVVKEFDNFNFHLLTEDVEFTSAYVLKKKKIGYNQQAEFFDEQPEDFKTSWKQRERWAKGYYQVLGKYGKDLIKGSTKSFSCYDVFSNIAPILIIAILSVMFYLTTGLVALFTWNVPAMLCELKLLALLLINLYGIFMGFAMTACITEWKKIQAPKKKKILYIFTFPFFMFTYLLIAISAIFRYKKIGWVATKHKGKEE